jgi:hypothetical protein
MFFMGHLTDADEALITTFGRLVEVHTARSVNS